MKPSSVLMIAADLLTEGGSDKNPEYDRALFDFTKRMLGISDVETAKFLVKRERYS